MLVRCKFVSITIGSLVILLYIIFAFFKYKNIKDIYKHIFILTLFIGTNVRMGYFIKFGENAISVYPVMLMFMAILGIVFVMQKQKYLIMNSLILKYAAFLVCVLIVNYVIFLIYPYRGEILVSNWDQYVHGYIETQYVSSETIETGYYISLINLIIVLLISQRLFVYEDWKDILQKIATYSRVIVVLGFLEYFITNIYQTKVFTDFYISIWGEEGAQQNYLYIRGLIYPVQGMTKEPGMFMTSLFYSGIFFVLAYVFSTTKKEKKREAIWGMLTVLLIALNMTLAGVIYVLILSVIYFCYGISDEKKIAKRIGVIILLTVLSVFIMFFISDVFVEKFLQSDNYLVHRIGLAIQQFQVISGGTFTNLVAGSESSRFSGINYSISMLAERPLLGFGIGVLKCISGVAMMATGLGILGLMAYVIFMLKLAFLNEIDFRKVMFFVFVVIVPNLILNDFSVFLELELPFICIVFGVNHYKKTTLSVNANERREKYDLELQ